MPEPIQDLTTDIPAWPRDCPTDSLADPRATTDAPAVAGPPAALPPSERYTLLDEIARGGMGVVYRATDNALSREVAVKVLQERFSPDSGTARRFAGEARIAAQLQHPGIPPVHDLGTLPDGRPFLCMKLIRGKTLEEWLAGRPDVASERGRFVAAFESVCQAIAYAHAHRVIHRDLKPANVMVGAFGEVQVMDWGLAKVLTESRADTADLGETTAEHQVVSLRDSGGLMTQTGAVLGTLAFMPPEQAVGAIDTVDQRSDVFGLGAILAVILTGQPPFVASSAEKLRFKAAQGDVADCLARLAACGAEPELVTLCQRCLSPKPEDRPADAGEVARAVAALRAAADERARRAEVDRVRVEGEKATAEARALEIRRRRRLGLAAAAALGVATLGGLGAVLFVQHRANAELSAKNAELAEQQAEVEARFETAQKAIATFHTGVSEDVLLKNAQFTSLRTRLLKEAAGFYDDLEKLLAGKTDPKSRKLLASGYSQLGELTARLGDWKQALAVHRKALALRRELAAAPGADAEARLEVARGLNAVGLALEATSRDQAEKLARALPAFEEERDLASALLEAELPAGAARAVLAESQHRIGRVLGANNKLDEALKAYETACALRRQLVDAYPDDARYRSALAYTLNNLGDLLSVTGKKGESLRIQEEAQALRQQLADTHPDDTQFLSDLAMSQMNIGVLYSAIGRPGEGLKSLERARANLQKLADVYPAVTSFRDEQNKVASNCIGIGNRLMDKGDHGEALKAYETARGMIQKLADTYPANQSYQNNLFASHYSIGNLLSRMGQPAEALKAHETARDVLQKLAAANPANPSYLRSLAYSHTIIAGVLAQAGKPKEALNTYQTARDILQKLVDAHPANTSYQSDLASNFNLMGRLQARQKHFAEAFAALDAGLGLRKKLADAHPTNSFYTHHLGYSHAYRGWAHVRAGHPTEAATDLRRVLELWIKDKGSDKEKRFELARALALLAGLAADAKSGVSSFEADAFANQAVAALRDALEAGWTQRDELNEPDFDALRKHLDFQTLVKELETKAAVGLPSLYARPSPGKK